MKMLDSNSGKLPIKLIIIVLLVALAGGAAFTLARGAKKPGGKAEEKKHAELTPWKLEEFVVNLRDQEETRYLKVNMVLEVEGPKPEAGGHGEGGGADEAKARDAIISVLTQKTFLELHAKDGMPKLKEELKAELNSTLEETKIANIYFTSYAMQ